MQQQSSQARDLRSGDLILSHFSLLGLEDFERRVAAAADAGFSGIGLFLGDYQRLRDGGHDDSWIERVLERHGLCLAEVEVLLEWCPLTHRGKHLLSLACHLAERFGVRHVHAIGPYSGTVDDAAKAFARLCDDTAAAGLQVALEHLPFTNVTTLADALTIVEAADRPNGGLCLDSWHHFRGQREWAVLANLPAERIKSIQINDGPEQPVDSDYYRDTVAHRLTPGTGSFDLERFLVTIRERGYPGPVSVEVLSEDLRELPAERVCRELARGARTLLQEPTKTQS